MGWGPSFPARWERSSQILEEEGHWEYLCAPFPLHLCGACAPVQGAHAAVGADLFRGEGKKKVITEQWEQGRSLGGAGREGSCMSIGRSLISWQMLEVCGGCSDTEPVGRWR